MKRGPLNITVMLGGPSAEREVSLSTGAGVALALREAGQNVTELDPQDTGWQLPPETDVVFLALHGTYGEDGKVQTELDQLGIPYTGCDAESSRVAFDKALSKEAFVAAGVPTAPFEVLTKDSDLAEILKGKFCPPVVLKPVCQGSSVGLQFVEREDEFPKQLRDSLRHGDRILLEPRIDGREVTVGVIDDALLPVVEICPKEGTYDFANKYTVGATEYHCPADLPEAITARIQENALQAFKALGCRDYARVDLMLTKESEVLVLEVNTLPGMTETSLLPKAAVVAGMSYQELCMKMIQLACDRESVTA
ncbi:MAG: D-alanine-D-alanine ligase [Limisphaerales bacterium]|jgi:D-alanine-D-alanine ligase